MLIESTWFYNSWVGSNSLFHIATARDKIIRIFQDILSQMSLWIYVPLHKEKYQQETLRMK